MYQNGYYELSRDNITLPNCGETINDCFPAHFHKALEIYYVIDGEIDATINGQTYTGTPGCFFLSSSYAIHGYNTGKSSLGYVMIAPYDIVKPYHSLFANKVFASPYLPASPENERLVSAMKEFHQFYAADPHPTSPVRVSIMNSYVNLIIGLLIDLVGLTEAHSDKGTLLSKDVLRYLQENYLEPLTLASISTHFGYSKSRFSHIFNQYFGCSLTDYLNTLRCRHACRLLSETGGADATITELSLACGFDSTRTFYRVFKNYTGITPTEYAKHGGTLPH